MDTYVRLLKFAHPSANLHVIRDTNASNLMFVLTLMNASLDRNSASRTATTTRDLSHALADSVMSLLLTGEIAQISTNAKERLLDANIFAGTKLEATNVSAKLDTNLRVMDTVVKNLTNVLELRLFVNTFVSTHLEVTSALVDLDSNWMPMA